MDGLPLGIPTSTVTRTAQWQDGESREDINLDLVDHEHYAISYPIADKLPGSSDGQQLSPIVGPIRARRRHAFTRRASSGSATAGGQVATVWVIVSASGLDCRCRCCCSPGRVTAAGAALNSLRRKVALNQEVTENSPIIP